MYAQNISTTRGMSNIFEFYAFPYNYYKINYKLNCLEYTADNVDTVWSKV